MSGKKNWKLNKTTRRVGSALLAVLMLVSVVAINAPSIRERGYAMSSVDNAESEELDVNDETVSGGEGAEDSADGAEDAAGADDEQAEEHSEGAEDAKDADSEDADGDSAEDADDAEQSEQDGEKEVTEEEQQVESPAELAKEGARLLSAEDGIYTVTAAFGEDAGIPENAELKVTELRPEDKEYKSLYNAADKVMNEEYDTGLTDPKLMNISILVDDKEIEPDEGSTVNVEIRMTDEAVDKTESDTEGDSEIENGVGIWVNGEKQEFEEPDNKELYVIHQRNDGETSIVEDAQTVVDEDGVAAVFTTDSFSNWLVGTGDWNKTIYVCPGDTISFAGIDSNNASNNIEWNVPNTNIASFKNVNNDKMHYIATISENATAGQRFTVSSTKGHSVTIIVKERPSQGNPPRELTEEDGIVEHAKAGITLNLFDYDLNGLLDERFNNFDYDVNAYASNYKNTSINKNKYFKFWGSGTGSWDQNQGKTQNGNDYYVKINGYQDGATTGIVQNSLINGYPVLNTSTGVPTAQSLDYLFNLNEIGTNGEDKKVYSNVDGLFQYKNGYYIYNSNENYAYYNESTNKFTVYNGTYTQKLNSRDENNSSENDNPSSKKIGFFPFHDWDEGWDRNVRWNKSLNHHFGLSMETKFTLPKGKVDQNGNEIVFEFSGDDDLWVFVDGRLAMDIGGIHQPTSGKIDFTTGTVTVSGSSSGQPNWLNSLDPNTEHTLQVFYIERGGCDSNCMIKFNTTRYGNVDFEKQDQFNSAVPGAKFALYTDLACTNQLKEYTAKNNYHYVEATSGANGHVQFTDIPVGTYYMKETVVPAGYTSPIGNYIAKVEVSNDGQTVVSYITKDGVVIDPAIITNPKILYGDVTFTKTDGSNNLPGAQFGLYTDAECSNPVMKDGTAVTATSGTNGSVSFTDILTGDYYMKETAAPEGYVLNNTTVYQVHIADKLHTGGSTDESKITLLDSTEVVTTITNEPITEVTVEKQWVDSNGNTTTKDNSYKVTGDLKREYKERGVRENNCTLKVKITDYSHNEGSEYTVKTFENIPYNAAFTFWVYGITNGYDDSDYWSSKIYLPSSIVRATNCNAVISGTTQQIQYQWNNNKKAQVNKYSVNGIRENAEVIIQVDGTSQSNQPTRYKIGYDEVPQANGEPEYEPTGDWDVDTTFSKSIELTSTGDWSQSWTHNDLKDTEHPYRFYQYYVENEKVWHYENNDWVDVTSHYTPSYPEHTVFNGDPITLTLTNTEKKKTNLVIHKVGSDLHSAEYPPLQGVSFQLTGPNNYNETRETNAQGNTEPFADLYPGTYTLAETIGLDDEYMKPSGDWTVTVNDDGELTIEGPNDITQLDSSNTNTYTYQLVNIKFYDLPSAGGPGTYLFTIGGVAMIFTALLLWIKPYRKEARTEE